MKPTKKQIRNKDVVKSHKVHHTVAARMEPKAKDAGLRSKSNPLIKRKPKKNTKSRGKI